MSIKRGATYEDLLKVPDNMVAEIVDGDLYASPRPRIRHGRVGSLLGAELVDVFDRGLRGPGGWWLLFEPELHLADDILVPDLAGWRRENLAALPDEIAFTLPPDWLCEILSPSTERLDRLRKLPAYARHQLPSLWLVDPKEKWLDVFRREGRGWLHIESYRGDVRVAAEPFDAVEIDLAAIWS